MSRTASEVAEEIVEEILFHKTYKNPLLEARDFVAQALTAYAEEQAVNIANATISEACKEARAEALEEAAKVAEDFIMPDGDHGTEIAQAIRALKDKP